MDSMCGLLIYHARWQAAPLASPAFFPIRSHIIIIIIIIIINMCIMIIIIIIIIISSSSSSISTIIIIVIVVIIASQTNTMYRPDADSRQTCSTWHVMLNRDNRQYWLNRYWLKKALFSLICLSCLRKVKPF